LLHDLTISSNRGRQAALCVHWQNIEKVSGYSPAEVYENGAQIYLESLHPEDVQKVREGFRALPQMTAKLGGNCRPTIFRHWKTFLKRRQGANLESRSFAKTSTERGFSNRREARCRRKSMIQLLTLIVHCAY